MHRSGKVAPAFRVQILRVFEGISAEPEYTNVHIYIYMCVCVCMFYLGIFRRIPSQGLRGLYSGWYFGIYRAILFRNSSGASTVPPSIGSRVMLQGMIEP